MTVEDMLKFTLNKKGERIYDVKPSKMSKKDIQKLAKRVNDSLYRLEKRGLQEDSREYQMIEYYAVKKNAKMYNVDLTFGTIRVTKDISRFQNAKELREYVNRMREILQTQTITVTGTKKALKKSKDIFEKSHPNLKKKLNFDEYRNVWKTWRTQVSKDKRDKLGSTIIIDLLNYTSFYTLTANQMKEALKYFNDKNSEYEAIQAMRADYPKIFEDEEKEEYLPFT